MVILTLVILINKGKNYKSIKKTDLRNALDPLTAVRNSLQ